MLTQLQSNNKHIFKLIHIAMYMTRQLMLKNAKTCANIYVCTAWVHMLKYDKIIYKETHSKTDARKMQNYNNAIFFGLFFVFSYSDKVLLVKFQLVTPLT